MVKYFFEFSSHMFTGHFLVLRSIPSNAIILVVSANTVVFVEEVEPLVISDMKKGKSVTNAASKTSKQALKSTSNEVAVPTENGSTRTDCKKDKITDFFAPSLLPNNVLLTSASSMSPDIDGASLITPSSFPLMHNDCPHKSSICVSSRLKTSATFVNGTLENSRSYENGASPSPSTMSTIGMDPLPPPIFSDQPKNVLKQARKRRYRVKLSRSPEKIKIARSPMMINRHLTEFYPIRRSCRQTRSRLMKEKQTKFEEILLSGKEEGLQITDINGKGRGVVATKNFKKGEFVVEYSGELITYVEAKRREVVYGRDQNIGCYMYYFIHNNRRYCVDATEETGRLGRLVNHSRNGNLVTKSFHVGEIPHLILVAKHDISAGEELLYDYGDRSKASLQSHPWLAT